MASESGTPGASLGARAFAAVGLATGWVLIGIPALALASLCTFDLVAGDIAAIIDGRVDPHTVSFGPALVVAVVALAIANPWLALRKRPYSWRRWVVAVGLVLLACSVLVVAAIFSTWTSPFKQVVKLIAWGIQVNVVVLLVMILVGVALARWLWRIARRGSSASVVVGLSVGASGLVSALFTLVLIVVLAAIAEKSLDDTWGEPDTSIADMVVLIAEDAREQARIERLARDAQLRTPFAARFLIREALASDNLARDACFEALGMRKRGEADSKIDQAGRFLRRRGGLSFEDARDLAADTALHVCTTAKLADVEAWRAYYWRSIQNARVDAFRSGGARRMCELTPARERRLRAPDYLEAGLDHWREQCLNKARCQLSDSDQSLLTLCVEYSVREIEARGIATRSDAQRKCAKIKGRVRQIYDRLCE